MVVVDASVVLEWLLNDARASDAEVVLMRVATEELRTPSLCWLEVGNVLQVQVRKGRIDGDFRDGALARMRALGLATDTPTEPGGRVLEVTIALAERFGLTAYDAAYLEAALRHGADLATFDKDLAAAARGAGVPLAISP